MDTEATPKTKILRKMQFTLLEQIKKEKQWPKKDGGKMTVSTKNREQHEITVGDWITFLASEKYAVTSNVLSTLALLVALVAILVAIPQVNVWVWVQWLRLFVYVGIIAYSVYWYFKLLRPIRERVKAAGELLKRIMLEEFNDSNSISKEWIALTSSHKKETKKPLGVNQLIQDPQKLKTKNGK